MNRLIARRPGMSTLQAVLLLGGAFVVVWGLMAVWHGVQNPLTEQTKKTLNGEPGDSVAGNRGEGEGNAGGGGAGDVGRNPPGEEGDTPPPSESSAAERLAGVAYDLYFSNRRFKPHELDEIKQFLQASNEILDTPLSHLVLSEVNLRQGNHWEGFTELLTALNPVDIILGRIKAAKQVADKLQVMQQAKKKVTAAERKALAEFEKRAKAGGSYDELSKLRKELPEHLRDEIEIHHLPAKSVSGMPEKQGPAIAMWKKDHRGLESTGGREHDGILADILERTEKGDLKGGFNIAITEIQERYGKKYDEAIKQAWEYAERMKWFKWVK